MKKIVHVLRIALFGMLLMFCLPVMVLADNEYRIPEATFEVEINEDGSASVHEQWNLEFISGSFTRFYKDISYYDLPEDEEFSEISDVSVWIDGKECEWTEDQSNRPEYHYNLTSNLPGATLAAYVKSSNISRTFDFYYTLKDCVKSVDNSYHLFVYRFIGADFSKKVDAVKIHVTAPDGAAAKILYCSKGDSSENGNEASVSCKNFDGMYKFRLRMDGAAIPGATNISSSSLSNKKDKPAFDFSIIGYLIPAGIFLWFAWFFIDMIIQEKKIYKILKNEGMVPIYKAVSELGKILDPTEMVYMVEPRGWLFPLHLAYMVSRGLILKKIGADNNVFLTIPEDYQKREVSPADAYVYSVVQHNVDEKDRTVTLKSLADYVTSTSVAKNINSKLSEMLKVQVKGKAGTDSKEFKKKVRWLGTASNIAKRKQLFPAISSEELFNSYISHINALYYQMNQFHPVSDHDMDEGYYYWDDLSSRNENSYTEYISSNSGSDGGGGCSSCSSCSSCGGGGAD